MILLQDKISPPVLILFTSALQTLSTSCINIQNQQLLNFSNNQSYDRSHVPYNAFCSQKPRTCWFLTFVREINTFVKCRINTFVKCRCKKELNLRWALKKRIIYSDETIVADDRLSIVLIPPMLLIDFKIKVADIANKKKKKIWIKVSFWFRFYFLHVKPDL